MERQLRTIVQIDGARGLAISTSDTLLDRVAKNASSKKLNEVLRESYIYKLERDLTVFYELMV